jgi:5-methylcytosine-specific restriction endonuclease McrA
MRTYEGASAASSRYRSAHPQRVKESNRSQRIIHRRRNLAYGASYREQNKESRALYNQKWNRSNRARKARNAANYKARKLNAAGCNTFEQVAARVAYYGWRCYLCGRKYEALDHVIPLSKGGSNWPANLRPICKRCNSSKKDRTLTEFLSEGNRRDQFNKIAVTTVLVFAVWICAASVCPW